MTLAWYGNLRFKGYSLWLVILVRWCIAVPEYALQVPAKRLGHSYFTASQLKIMQEVISLAVFMIFAAFYLGEKPTIINRISFMIIVGADVVAFWDDFKIN